MIILRKTINSSYSNFDLHCFIFKLHLSSSNNHFCHTQCHVQNLHTLNRCDLLKSSRGRFAGCLTVMERTCREHREPVRLTGDSGRRLQRSAGWTLGRLTRLESPAFVTLPLLYSALPHFALHIFSLVHIYSINIFFL